MNEKTNARRRAVSGSHHHPGRPELTKEIATAIRGVSEPGLTPGGGSRRLPYRRVPYGRAESLPTSDSSTSTAGLSRPRTDRCSSYAGSMQTARVLDVLFPVAWVSPIDRDEPACIEVYDILEEQDPYLFAGDTVTSGGYPCPPT